MFFFETKFTFLEGPGNQPFFWDFLKPMDLKRTFLFPNQLDKHDDGSAHMHDRPRTTRQGMFKEQAILNVWNGRTTRCQFGFCVADVWMFLFPFSNLTYESFEGICDPCRFELDHPQFVV